MAWLGAAVVGFVAFGEELVVRANLGGGGHLESSVLVVGLAAFLGCTGAWLAALVRAFKVPA
jgi:hypothetical protein